MCTEGLQLGKKMTEIARYACASSAIRNCHARAVQKRYARAPSAFVAAAFVAAASVSIA